MFFVIYKMLILNGLKNEKKIVMKNSRKNRKFEKLSF